MTTAEPKFLTVAGIAIELGVAESRVDRAMRLGRIPYVLAGRYRVVDVADIAKAREALGVAPERETEGNRG